VASAGGASSSSSAAAAAPPGPGQVAVDRRQLGVALGEVERRRAALAALTAQVGVCVCGCVWGGVGWGSKEQGGVAGAGAYKQGRRGRQL
jgi:hypothetical protein